jgi:uncharacterized protein (DUF4415 family)
MNAKFSSKKSQTDWDRVDRLSDNEIDTSDIPSLDAEFFKNAKLHIPTRKKSITVRLDNDVLEWYKSQGKGYQTKINAILRTYMDAHTK